MNDYERWRWLKAQRRETIIVFYDEPEHYCAVGIDAAHISRVMKLPITPLYVSDYFDGWVTWTSECATNIINTMWSEGYTVLMFDLDEFGELFRTAD